MKSLRQIHLYLGCLFAPLLMYFAVTGAWQLYRFNDVPKGETAPVRSVLREISKPHTHSTLPGGDPKTEKSSAFNLFSLLMAIGIASTSVLGVIIALRSSRRPTVLVCLLMGVAIPIVVLYLK